MIVAVVVEVGVESSHVYMITSESDSDEIVTPPELRGDTDDTEITYSPSSQGDTTIGKGS